jgi:uncharacterized protein YcgI (DUF1989 family)
MAAEVKFLLKIKDDILKTNQDNHPIKTRLLEPHTGLALEIRKDDILKVIDLEGGQVVDLVSYSQQMPQECLSSPRTVDFNNRIFFSTGDVLYSDRSNHMWTITSD